MLENGWIKLYRSLLKWEWYDDINTKVVFLHLLLTVSIEDSKWHGVEVKRGSRVISYAKLAKETKLSLQQLRTSLSHLESTGEITRYKHPKFTIISLKNFDKFQELTSCATANQQSTNIESTNNQQATNNSIRKYKKDKKKEEINILADKPPAQKQKAFTPPTADEVRAYCMERHNGIDADYFVDYYTANGWTQGKGRKPIRDWKATVRTWERNAVNKNQTTERSAESGADSRINEGFI